jgi:hypothetical protein
VFAAIALASLVLGRLPFLIGEEPVPDGDEAILGLMAIHALQGREVPVFFYGQSYGLSTVEALAAAAAFAVGDPSTLSLKGAMLALWALGGMFLALAARELGGSRSGWIALVLLVACPAWGVWALKARGGYLTAFLAASLCLWLACRSARLPLRPVTACGLGFAAAIAGLGMPLFLASVLPLLALLLLRNRRAIVWVSCFLGAAAPILVAWISVGELPYWRAPGFAVEALRTETLGRIGSELYTLATGRFYLESPLSTTWIQQGAAVLWTAALVAALAWGLVDSWKARTLSIPGACFWGCLATLAALAGVAAAGSRYLLPLVGPAIFLFSQWGGRGDRARWRAALVAVTVLAVAGYLSVLESAGMAGRVPIGTPYRISRADLGALVEALDERAIRAVYSVDPLLQWILTFETRERVVARWLHPRDRYPAYPRRVDQALRRGEPTAVVGLKTPEQLAQLKRGLSGLPPARRPGAARSVGEGVWVVERPGPRLIRSLGFVIGPP